jgi:hypothetical protein
MHRRLIVVVPLALALSAGPALGAPRSAAADREQFTISGTTVDGKSGPIAVRATGPIAGRGTARLVEHGQITHATLRLAHGKVFVRYVERSKPATHQDLQACMGTIRASGTFTITGGTGRYAGATGSGTFTEHRTMRGQRDGDGICLPDQPPAKVTATARAAGSARIA